jgi:hypothetical protein
LEVRERYQAWIQELWRQKDALIHKLLEEDDELAT